MQPYEFGLRVGYMLEKQARHPARLINPMDDTPARGWGGFLKDTMFGTAPLATQIADPMQRGLAQHIAGYSNPVTGVPMAINDTARHLYNGRYLSALGSMGEGALSFLPGAGFAARGVRAGLTTGGKALAARGAVSAGNALRSGAAAIGTGRRAVVGAQNAMASGIQKVLPKAAPAVTAAPGASRAAQMGAAVRNAPTTARNFIASKPIQAAAGGFGPLDPLTAGSLARGEHFMTPEGREYQAYMKQMQQTPQMPATGAPLPPTSNPLPPMPKPQPGSGQFRPRSMLGV